MNAGTVETSVTLTPTTRTVVFSVSSIESGESTAKTLTTVCESVDWVLRKSKFGDEVAEQTWFFLFRGSHLLAVREASR